MKNILLNSDTSHINLDHQSDCLFSQIWLYLIKYLLQLEIMADMLNGPLKCLEYCLSHCLEQLYSCIFNSYLKRRRIVKVFLFTSCRCVYRCICDDSVMSFVCPLINYTLATEENVCYVRVRLLHRPTMNCIQGTQCSLCTSLRMMQSLSNYLK